MTNAPVRIDPMTSRYSKVKFATNMGCMPMKIENSQWTAAEVREWATQQGIDIAQRGRIPSYVVQLYLARPAVVREWARQQGFDIGRRGPLSSDVVESYLTRPAAVREWARQQGIEIGDRGRIPNGLVESYLEQFGDLTRRAA